MSDESSDARGEHECGGGVRRNNNRMAAAAQLHRCAFVCVLCRMWSGGSEAALSLCRYAVLSLCRFAATPQGALRLAHARVRASPSSNGLCCAQAVWPPHEHRERRRMCACARRRLALAPRRAAARVSACRADVDGAVLSPGASRCRCGVRRDERRRRNVGASGSGTSSRGKSGGRSGGGRSGGRGSGGSGETRQRPPRCERSGVRRL